MVDEWSIKKLFDEDVLRAAIVSVWGEHGAHIDVFDAMANRAAGANLSQDVIEQVINQLDEDASAICGEWCGNTWPDCEDHPESTELIALLKKVKND